MSRNDAKVLKAYLGDYAGGFHVREMAKAAGISPSAASYMAKALEKRRILDHKVEGRNKKYFINSGNPAAKDMLAAAEIARKTEVMEKHFVIRKMVNEMEFNGIAVLFGSFAKGTADENSDIDILLIGRKNAALEDSLERFGKLYKRKMHVMSMSEKDFLHREKKEFVAEILKNHALLNGTEAFVNMLWRMHHET